MIVLFFIVVALLSFTRVPMWLQVVLMLVPPIVLSALAQDASLLKIAVLALVGALLVYAPIVFVGSLLLPGGFRAVFKRLRLIYFVCVIPLFVVLTFNLPQLVGIL